MNSTENKALNKMFTPKRFAVVLFLLVLAAYPDVLLFGQSFVFRDFSIFGYPLAFYHRESIWNGEIPLWNPYNNCGIPFLAQWNTLTLYPLTFIYLLLPMPWSVSLFCLVHLYLAGLGMYFLARQMTRNDFAATLAGIAFAFNGLMMHALMWPNNMAALGCMPWVLLLTRRAWEKGGSAIAIAALVGGMQMLSGGPEIVLFTWMIVGFFWLFDVISNRSLVQMIRRIVPVVLLTAGLAAAQLLPFLELLHYSQRGASFADASWSMPKLGWLNFLVPLFGTRRGAQGVFTQIDQYWTSSYYVGVTIFSLSVFAIARVRKKEVACGAILCVVGLLLALGENSFVYPILRKVLPGSGLMRFPIKWVVPLTFVFPLLAAFGVAALSENPNDRKRRLRYFTAIGSVLFVGIISAAVAGQGSAVIQNALVRAGFLVLGLVAIGLIIYSKKERCAQIAITILLWTDLITHMPRQNPSITANVFEPNIVAESEFKPKPVIGQSRTFLTLDAFKAFYTRMLPDLRADFLGRRITQLANFNLLDHVPKTDGFYSLYLRDTEPITDALFYAQANQFPVGLADFLGVSYVGQMRQGTLEWNLRNSHLPWVTIGQKPIFAEKRGTYDRLKRPEFDPRAVVYIDSDVKHLLFVTNEVSAKIISTKFSPHQIDIQAEAEAPAVLSVAQSFYPAWSAFLDGKEVPIFHANYSFQGIAVPAGKHEIKFIYRDRQFRIGAIISVFSLSVCVAWLFCFRARSVKRTVKLL